MAKQNKRSTTTRKSVRKKVPPKRRKRKSKKSTLKKDLIIFFSVLALIAMVSLGYMLGRSEPLSKKSNPATVLQNGIAENKQFIENIERAQQKKLIEKEKRKQEALRKAEFEAKKRIQKQKEKNVLTITERPIDSEGNVSYKEVKAFPKNEKPKLVIIIDDVSTRTELDRILSLNLKLTPSIFPPFKRSPRNHRLAEGLIHYMIHLPMESGKSFDKQAKTLMVSDSKEMIEARVKEIRRLFPGAHYVNNHTGSVFTADYKKMEILYMALKKEGFIFIDSRTTNTTTVPKIAKKYAQHYLARDTFIDNKQNQVYIHRQLRYAVNRAKKRGYAIAIGHPHKVTLKTLANAKHILQEVEVVYIDELRRGEKGP